MAVEPRLFSPITSAKSAANGRRKSATIPLSIGRLGSVARANIPDDFRFSMTNAPGKDAYPISGATWLLVYEQQKDATKGKKLVEFLKWAMKDGEKMAKDLDYASLPESVQQRVLKRIDEIKM